MASPRVAPAALVPGPASPQERAKREAARRAVDDYVTKPGMRLGIGSGSTVVYAIQRLAERVHGDERLAVAACVPTSFQSRVLLSDAGLPISDLATYPMLDVAIDGADEVDPQLNLIKGGGACQTQEKVVAAAADILVVVADTRKCAPRGLLSVWRKGVPIEVVPLAYAPVMSALQRMGGVPKLRMGEPSKAGPVVSDNGGFIIDCDFPEAARMTFTDGRPGTAPAAADAAAAGGGSGSARHGLHGAAGAPALLHAAIKALPGVIETGIFPAGTGVVRTVKAYFGGEDGSVTVWTLGPAS